MSGCVYTLVGLHHLLLQHPSLGSADVISEQICWKETGERKKLRRWSRGHQFIIRAGGNIDLFQPLYMEVQRKESDQMLHI